jgi:glycosyltransferase involved in cell wall biosynthesis
LIKRKGVEVIVEAFSCLPSPKNYKLSIVGDGCELKDLKELVKKKSLGEFVEFVGQIPAEKVANYLRAADALVLASYSEGRPNVVLESFAVGVPVIASDIEGVHELLRDDKNGLKFKPGDAKELALKIEMLQQNKELQIQLSKNGREFILKNHLLWKNVGQKYAQFYSEAIQN